MSEFSGKPQVGSSSLDLVGFTRMRCDPRMPQRARTWTGGLAERCADGEVVATVRLLTSELATNALRYGPEGGEVQVAFLCGRGLLRVEVTDQGAGVPAPRDAALDDEDGRGLFLLDALARSWGHGPGPAGHGTTVWFELDAPGA